MRVWVAAGVLAAVVAGCAPDPVDVSQAADTTLVATSDHADLPSSSTTTRVGPVIAIPPDTTSMSTEFEPIDGPVGFARSLLAQTESWKEFAFDCVSLELHDHGGGEGILSVSYEGGDCGGDGVQIYLRYASGRLAEEASSIDSVGDPANESAARFERLATQAKRGEPSCIDVPTNRLVAPDRWLGSCPPADPSNPREVVARILQQTATSATWSDDCVDLLLVRATRRSGVLNVRGIEAPDCSGPRDLQVVYEDHVVKAVRAAADVDAILGDCIRLSNAVEIPSVGWANCGAERDGRVDETLPGTDAVDRAHGQRLAYSDGDNLWLVSQTGAPVRVGPGAPAAWSTDGRFLAWLPDWPAASSVAVLDTDRGAMGFAEVDGGEVDTLLPLWDGFAAAASGTGAMEASLRVHLVTPASGFARASYLAVGGLDPLSAGPDVSIEWSSDGRRLYAAIATDSATWYRTPLGVWAVGELGQAVYLFNDCDGDERCENNSGMRNLSPSPDGSHITYNGGVRNGCRVAKDSKLTPSGGYDPIPLRWSDGPAPSDGGYFTLGEASWVSPRAFVAVATVITPDLFESCEALPVGQVVSCGIDGNCRSLGIEATAVAADTSGDLAVVRRSNEDSAGTEGVIRWADGSQTLLPSVEWQWMVWSGWLSSAGTA